MFENHVSELLREYLGEYLVGLDKEALRISVWKGVIGLTRSHTQGIHIFTTQYIQLMLPCEMMNFFAISPQQPNP